MWQEFAAMLNELNKIYSELVQIGQQKHQALVAIDMKTLASLLEKEEPLTKQAGQLEKKRQQILVHLAATNWSIKKDTKLEQIIALAPTPQLQQILKQLHKSLSENTRKAKELSDNNTVLIKAAMQAAAWHLNRIGGARVEPTYGQAGGENVSHRQNFEFKA